MKPTPYITRTVTIDCWNPDYPQKELCMCGHVYYRHFDTYEYMEPVGCKYCSCLDFEEFPEEA